jgi:hypothetical protein
MPGDLELWSEGRPPTVPPIAQRWGRHEIGNVFAALPKSAPMGNWRFADEFDLETREGASK